MFNDLDIYNKKYRKKILQSIQKTIIKNNFIFGNDVKKLEENLSKLIGSKYVCTVGSGTDALLISLLSLDLKKVMKLLYQVFLGFQL